VGLEHNQDELPSLVVENLVEDFVEHLMILKNILIILKAFK